MNADVEELLRQSIDRLTAGARAPTGLAGRARRRHWQRRQAARGITAAGAAVVTAAAVFVTGGASTGTGGTIGSEQAPPGTGSTSQAQTAAYVVGRVQQAVTAASAARSIVYVRLISRHVISSGIPAARRVSTWYFGDRARSKAFAADGKILIDDSDNYSKTPASFVTVNYQNSTWWHCTGRPGIRFSGCSRTLLPLADFPAWTLMHRELSSRDYTVVGRQRLDGIDAIKLVTAPGSGLFPLTISVDPSTYLPVRIVEFASAGRKWQQADLRWLLPTRTNLAKLHVTVPARFRLGRPRAGLTPPLYIPFP